MMSETSCTWNTLVLLCLFLGLFQLQLTEDLAKISDCSSNIRPIFNEGSNLSLCCRLEPPLCNNTTLADNLIFVYKSSTECPNACTVTRLNKCELRMDVRNVSKGDEGQYSCTVKNLTYANEYVQVYETLPPINITKFVCTYDKMITVTFDRGVPQIDDILYTVSMIMWRAAGAQRRERRNIPDVMCNGTYSSSRSSGTMCQAAERECVCQFSDTFYPGDGLPRDYNATITVTQHRNPNQTKYTNRTFSVLDNIIPGPLSIPDPVQVTANQAVIMMCTDDKTQECIYFVYGKYRPILYHILVNKTEGILEHLEATIPTVKVCWCLRIRLTNLTAFTTYSMLAYLSAGGGNGAETRKNFTTDMTVPTHPPKLDVYSFLRWSKVDKYRKGTPAITIMWHPLPEEAQGGSNLSYIVQVTSFSGFKDKQTVTDTYAVFANELLTTNLTVRIWAQNDVGLTESHSELEVPYLRDTRTTKTHVEFDGDRAAVYVHLDDPQKCVQLHVHWCQNYTDTKVTGVSICQEHPVTGFTTSSVQETMQFVINLTTSSHCQETTENAILEYSHETPPNIDNGEYELMNAKLTTQRLCRQSFSHYDVYADIKPILEPVQPVSIHKRDIQNTARRKRFLWSKVRGGAMGVFGRHAREAEADSKGMDNTGHQYPRMFISLVPRDKGQGLNQHGLIPVDCYFDKQKNKVKVEVYDVTDESGYTVYWNQTCQGEPPEYSRADYFCVSFGSNCDNDECPTPQYYNKIDQQNKLRVTNSSKDICFYAYTNESYYGSTTWSKPIYTLNDISSTEVPPGVIAAVVAACVITIILGLLSYACYRRWKSVRLILNKNIVQLPVSFEIREVQNAATNPTDTMESPQPSCSDSGRGSALEETDAGLGKAVHLKLLDQAVRCATGSLPSEITATCRVNSGDNKWAAENNHDHEEEEPAEQDNALEMAESCFNSHASGHSQYSGEDDGGGSSGCDEDEVEEDAAQQQAFEAAKMCFHYHTSGDTQSSCGGNTDEGADYSRSVIYSGSSNSYEDARDVLVKEEEKFLE